MCICLVLEILYLYQYLNSDLNQKSVWPKKEGLGGFWFFCFVPLMKYEPSHYAQGNAKNPVVENQHCQHDV